MRANLPRPQNSSHAPEADTPHAESPSLELGGAYLQAMQAISTCLMEKLPAEDSLWQTLSQTESLLIGAQMTQTPLHDVFGAGGIAAFCQSIVDEYYRNHPQPVNTKRAGHKRPVPAAADRSLRESHNSHDPRGGINYHRKRRATALLIAGFSLLFVLLALWYTGMLSYLTKGSAYYLDELYHFDSTRHPASDEPITFTVPLEAVSDIGRTLYADAEGNTLTLSRVRYEKKLIPVEEDTRPGGEQIYRESYIWCIRIRYSVDVGYLKVRYVEPGFEGTATLTLPDGEVITSALSLHDSGSDGRGYEYIEFEVATIPAATSTDGTTLSVTIAPPNAVTWTRIGVGPRS